MAFDAVMELREELKGLGKDENIVDINSWLMGVNWCKDFIIKNNKNENNSRTNNM